MHDATGKTICSGDRVRLKQGYWQNGISYPAGTVGVYQSQKAGAGFLIALVQIGAETVEVSSMDIAFVSRGAQVDFVFGPQKAEAPGCPQCHSALEYFGGADDYCPKCGTAARYMKLGKEVSGRT
jgi:hypothetical protein